MFSDYENGRQTGNAWYATGAQARQAEPGGEVLAEGFPVSFRRHRPARGSQRDPAGRRAAERPVLRRRRRCPARLRLDWARRLRRQQRRLDRAGGTRRHARRPGHRRVGLDQPVQRRHARATGPRREPNHQPFINPDGEKNLFNSPPSPADDVANYLEPWSAILPERRRLHPRAGQGSRPAGPARTCCGPTAPSPPPTQRPGTHRRRVQPALRLADQRQGPRPASSRTTTCWPTFPTWARPTPARPASPVGGGRLVRQAALGERAAAGICSVMTGGSFSSGPGRARGGSRCPAWRTLCRGATPRCGGR